MTGDIGLVMLLNFLVDFLLILAASRLAGHPPGYGRAGVAAWLGGIYGGVCLLPRCAFLAGHVGRLASLCVMSWVAFGWNAGTLRRGLLFCLLSVAINGTALGIGSGKLWAAPVAAVGIWLLCFLGFPNSGGTTYVPVTIRHSGRTVRFTALRDTGNTLRDPVTGQGVIIAGAQVAQSLTGLNREELTHPVETVSAGKHPGLRLIPYRTVGNSGMLLAMRFEHVQAGKRCGSCLVAFAPQRIGVGSEYQALTGGTV